MKKAFFAMLFLLFQSQGLLLAQVLTDPIQQISLVPGKADSLLLSDLFYSPSYNVQIKENPFVKAEYDQKTGFLKFLAKDDFHGMTLLDFSLQGKTYSIPVETKNLIVKEFRFHSLKEYKSVFLFGSFNGWDRKQYQMKKDRGDFILSIPMEPGRYEYKYFADGKELTDPGNPDSTSNGQGSFNSVVTLQQKVHDNAYLHVYGKNIRDKDVSYTFLYERENQPEALKKNDVLALLDNERLKDDELFISGNQVELRLNKASLQGQHRIRIALCQASVATNTQTVMLDNGVPMGDGQKFSSWYDGIIYSIMIDRFNDGDQRNNHPVLQDSLSIKGNYMGGDLRGICDKINEGYFDSLGVNVLWLSPINENPKVAMREFPAPHRYFSAYHGYWPSEPKKVEPNFGGMKVAKELVRLAHKHGIKVILDYVSHHVYKDHPFFQRHKDWFGSLMLPDGSQNLRRFDEYRLTTWFEPFLPSFDYTSSKAAVDTMTDNAIWWLKETKVDGFRHDAVKHVPNLFWRALTRKIQTEIEIPQKRHIYQIGETFGNYDLINSYINNGQLDAQFNFGLYDNAVKTFLDPASSFSVLNLELKKGLETFGTLNLTGNIMDSHDKIRFIAMADGDVPLSGADASEIGWSNPPRVNNEISYEKAKLYLAFMNTIPGLPVIYYGDEIGMSGSSDPDNRRMMRFDNDISADEQIMLDDVSQILHLRRSHSALRYGDFLPLKANENFYAYLRSDMNERLLIILNKSNETRDISLNIPTYYDFSKLRDLITDEEIQYEGHQQTLTIPAYGYAIYSLIQ